MYQVLKPVYIRTLGVRRRAMRKTHLLQQAPKLSLALKRAALAMLKIPI
jgi:hypothetical protein